jgi:hypothetical protein
VERRTSNGKDNRRSLRDDKKRAGNGNGNGNGKDNGNGNGKDNGNGNGKSKSKSKSKGKAKASAAADPCGMTNKGTGNSKGGRFWG